MSQHPSGGTNLQRGADPRDDAARNNPGVSDRSDATDGAYVGLEAERLRNLEEMDVEQLILTATDLHVEVDDGWSKEQLIEAIEEAQRLDQSAKNRP
jgi:hypothetical protein